MKRASLLLNWIFLTRFWTWLLNQLFDRAKNLTLIKWRQFAQGAILVLIFVIFNFLLQKVNLPALQEEITSGNSLFFLGYCGILLLSFPFIFKQTKNIKIWLQIGIGLFSLGSLTITGNLNFLTTNIAYYLLLAYAEEIFKFSTAHLNSEKTQTTSISKLLLFAILIWFSFSLAETLLAILIHLTQWKNISSGLLLGRGLISSIIHILATGSIALLLMKWKEKTNFQIFFALWVGFFIHAIYNISLHFKQGSIWSIIAIIGFFGLSLLLYHLDELYLSSKDKNS